LLALDNYFTGRQISSFRLARVSQP